jgi:uncharacterized membrane protein
MKKHPNFNQSDFNNKPYNTNQRSYYNFYLPWLWTIVRPFKEVLYFIGPFFLKAWKGFKNSFSFGMAFRSAIVLSIAFSILWLLGYIPGLIPKLNLNMTSGFISGIIEKPEYNMLFAVIGYCLAVLPVAYGTGLVTAKLHEKVTGQKVTGLGNKVMMKILPLMVLAVIVFGLQLGIDYLGAIENDAGPIILGVLFFMHLLLPVLLVVIAIVIVISIFFLPGQIASGNETNIGFSPAGIINHMKVLAANNNWLKIIVILPIAYFFADWLFLSPVNFIMMKAALVRDTVAGIPDISIAEQILSTGSMGIKVGGAEGAGLVGGIFYGISNAVLHAVVYCLVFGALTASAYFVNTEIINAPAEEEADDNEIDLDEL